MYKISDEQYANVRAWVHEYIDRICIVRDTSMPGKKPGTKYSWMFYLRRGLFDKKFINAISQMFIYKIEREVGVEFDFQLSGCLLYTSPSPRD